MRNWAVLFVASVGLGAMVGPAGAQPAGGGAAEPILNTKSFWRFRTVRETPELRLPDGKVIHGAVHVKKWLRSKDGPAEVPPANYTVERLETVRLPADTPADWMKPDFDDSAWARLHGPMLDHSARTDWKLILMRGRFEVTDPASAGELKLSLAFRGGAAVYLNGKEIARSHLPDRPIGLYDLAEAYPDEVYFTDEGTTFLRRDRAPAELARIAKRTRKLTDVKLPPEKLQKGVNVLAVAIHRSAKTSTFYIRRYKGTSWGEMAHSPKASFSEAGLVSIQLAAPAGSSAVPNVGLTKGRGFKVWNQSIIQKVFLHDYPDPFSPLAPIRLTGVRNGTFAGEVIVGDDTPIKGLRAVPSALKGPAVIPASAVTVRYALPDGAGKEKWFDSLADDPPAEVPVYPEHGGAVQPIWVTVSVPPDARPGDYEGAITVRAEGVKPREVPLKLRVIDWSLPPVSDYVTTMDIIQSPETVAMAYDLPLWSDKHLKLLDRTFSLLGAMGAKTLYITCIRRTHFGNEHAMVRWARDDDDELQPDFRIVEKYLDVALKHIPKPRGVILYCWEPPESQGHAGKRPWDKPVLITEEDPDTGELFKVQGPAIGTPESKVFWKKLTDGIRPVLKKRGLEDAMLLGLIGDSRPTKVAMDDMAAGLNGRDGWAIHSHLFCSKWQGHDVAFVNSLWGIGLHLRDPRDGYAFGWSNPLWLSYYPREMHMTSTLVEHRVKLESWMGARKPYSAFIAPGTGARGLGRLGGDFWKVVKDRRGRVRSSLAGIYPEAAWGQLNLNFCIPYLLGKGPHGAMPTVRSETLRLGLQEVETRIYVEKAWLDKQGKTLLGEDLLGRIRAALDERIRMCINSPGEGESWYIASGWNDRTERLLRLAAEASKKLGRPPEPDLTCRTRAGEVFKKKR